MVEVKVPELSESVSEATLLDWDKAVGDTVREGDVLVEVETDKITMEVYAPCDGVLESIALQSGASVQGGDLLARIEPGAVADAPPAAESSAKSEAKKPIAMPSAKKIAEEQGIALSEVEGSGKGGRITKGDVLGAARGGAAGHVSVHRAEHRLPMSRARARIAERLLQSQQETATLTTFNEANMQAILDLRAAYKETFEKVHGVRLGIMSFFVKAAVSALKSFPVMNASVEGNDVVYHEYYDIGVAVAAERGLVVPVIRDADSLSMAEIERQIADYGGRAKTGALSLDEISGGTFTITNGGVFGSLLSTPIINPPQSAILGVHATAPRPVAEAGQVVIRPMCYLAVSYDHRIIDGSDAVRFLVAVKNALENPARILLGV